MTDTPFDDLTDLYETMIDWPKRLAYEAPFFRQLFEQAKVKSVADVACGTGRHAHLFRSWGVKVQASDSVFGNHMHEPYHPGTSSDLIMVAVKGGAIPVS